MLIVYHSQSDTLYFCYKPTIYAHMRLASFAELFVRYTLTFISETTWKGSFQNVILIAGKNAGRCFFHFQITPTWYGFFSILSKMSVLLIAFSA